MAFSKLLPMLVMGGTAIHGSGAIKERAKGLFGAKEKFIAKQNINNIIETTMLDRASGGNLDFSTEDKFRTWVRAAIKIKGNRKADPSIDPWGTPYRGILKGADLTVTSAGADRQFDTKDDIRDQGSIDDY